MYYRTLLHAFFFTIFTVDTFTEFASFLRFGMKKHKI